MKTARSMVAVICTVVSIVALSGFASEAPGSAETVSLGLTSMKNMHPNGNFSVELWSNGRWQAAGDIACDRFFREQALDLSGFIPAGRETRIRITQHGGGAAHIDSALLGGIAPASIRGNDDPRGLRKIAVKDFDVIDAFGKTVELVFPPVFKKPRLVLTARIEGPRIGATPFQFPLANLFRQMNEHSQFYTYHPGKDPSPAPLFKEFSPTGSGHPSGYTYGWVSNDDRNLYVRIDFTPDNTMDGDKDYAKVFVKTGR